MTLSVQDLIVSLMALGAAWVIVRRVFGVFRPGARPHCSNCASGAAACSTTPAAAPVDPDKPAPLVLHRR